MLFIYKKESKLRFNRYSSITKAINRRRMGLLKANETMKLKRGHGETTNGISQNKQSISNRIEPMLVAT